MTDAAMMDDFQTPLRGAFTKSLVMHMAVIVGLTGYAWWNGPGKALGDPDAGGPAVGVELVASIPIPSKGPENPVANDSDSEVPQTPPEKVAPKAVPEPEPRDAVAILPPEKKPKQPALPKLIPFKEISQNQLKSTTPQAVSNPILAAKAGSGQIGTFGDTTLGTEFPQYASQVKDIARRSWKVNDVDRSITTGPPVTVTFTLLRDGRTQGIQLLRKSGIASLDLSVLRAIEDAHFPPLPGDYRSVPVNLTFELAR
ncbi:MAG: TonB family protein [Acidobacteriota bacterium]